MFIEIFISPHGFEVLMVSCHLTLQDSREHFLQARSSGHKLPPLLSGNVLISSRLLNSFAGYRILGWQGLLMFALMLYIYWHAVLWPPTFLMRNFYVFLLTISCEWWFASLLLLARFAPCLLEVWLECFQCASEFILLGSFWASCIICVPIFHQIWLVFSHSFFVLCPFLSWDSCNMHVDPFDGVP